MTQVSLFSYPVTARKGKHNSATYIYLFIYFKQKGPFRPLTVNTVGYKKSPGHAILLCITSACQQPAATSHGPNFCSNHGTKFCSYPGTKFCSYPGTKSCSYPGTKFSFVSYYVNSLFLQNIYEHTVKTHISCSLHLILYFQLTLF